MKALIKIIVLVAVATAAVSFFRSDGAPAFQRVIVWAKQTVEHMESLSAEQEVTFNESGKPVSEPAFDVYVDEPSEMTVFPGGALITSQVGLSERSRSEDQQAANVSGKSYKLEVQKRSGSESMKWVKKVTEQYAPTAWHLLMLYDALPSHQEVESNDDMVMSTQKTTSTFAYLQGRSATVLLGEMATNVHEIAHGYGSQYVFSHARKSGFRMSWDDVSVAYYLSPEKTYTATFPKSSLFPSAELVREIPRDLRTFRFDAYVNGNTSTQGQGVLGLLDEFHAYYQGARCSYDLLDAYVLAEGSAGKGFHEWIRSLQSAMSAYWEFDFFIREYLLRMSSHYPDDYDLLIRRGEFTDTYQGFRKAYSDLINKYEARVTETAARIDASGEASVNIKDGTVWINYPESSRIQGVKLFDDARAVLEPVINSRRYDKIAVDLSTR
jgi:hypothetical protein